MIEFRMSSGWVYDARNKIMINFSDLAIRPIHRSHHQNAPPITPDVHARARISVCTPSPIRCVSKQQVTNQPSEHTVNLRTKRGSESFIEKIWCFSLPYSIDLPLICVVLYNDTAENTPIPKWIRWLKRKLPKFEETVFFVTFNTIPPTTFFVSYSL